MRIFLVGKRPGQPVVAATDCSPPGRRLVIADRDTRHGFLIDTGSEICCFPRRILLILTRFVMGIVSYNFFIAVPI